ncbi:hypothetical protein ACT8ZV_10170 [Nocardioides sp. MAHUQ-72]|uniref:hypothetical protein n=1 Tax=unclassified Nocardioides TaxID=2615069 RepID=UPI00361AAB6E
MTGPYREPRRRDLSAAYDDAVGDAYADEEPWPRDAAAQVGPGTGDGRDDPGAWDDDEDDWPEDDWLEDWEIVPEEWRRAPMRMARWVQVSAALAAALVVAVLLWLVTSGAGSRPDAGGPAEVGAEPPAALPKEGAYVESRVLESGDIVVDQWIRAEGPIRTLTVRAPTLPGTGIAPHASELRVTGRDGQRVRGPSEVGDRPRTFVLERPAGLLHLTYRLEGAVDRSADSATGRALARITSLDVAWTPRSGPVRVAVVGAGVRNLACSGGPVPALMPRPCGAPHETGWTVRLEGARRDDHVTAQVDLGASAAAASG